MPSTSPGSISQLLWNSCSGGVCALTCESALSWVRMRGFLVVLLAFVAACGQTREDPTFITIASTTSTKSSGLLDHLLPAFEQSTGIEVRVVAVGTGQALARARNGEADVLLVHHRPSEWDFVSDGFGLKRLGVMYNDFVLVGPEEDPARVANAPGVPEALQLIERSRVPFVSRGDDSGTHKKELALWREAGVDLPVARAGWYHETGVGMGATLNIAAGMSAYTLSDRAAWARFENKRGIRLLFEGDQRLLNPYGVIVVNPAKHPHVKVEAAQTFAKWLTGPEGQKMIASYRIGGHQMYYPSARN